MKMTIRAVMALMLMAAFTGAASAASVISAVDEAIPEIEKKLPELKVRETVLNVSPRTRYYLPNGSLDLSLQQKYNETLIDFGARYDFVDNFMGFAIDFLYDFRPFACGIGLSDRVDFKETFGGTDYMQRNQAIAPYLRYIIREKNWVQTTLRFENTHTDAVGLATPLDAGSNILGEIGLFRDTVEDAGPVPRGENVSVTLQHSFNNWGSDYEYTSAELNLRQFISPAENHYVEYRFQAAYPLETVKRPLTSIYYAGGYRVLRGFNFKEFSGDALISSMLAFNFPIKKIEQENERGRAFSMLTWNVFSEAAKIGGRDIYTTPGSFHFSAGVGVGYKIDLFNRFPMQMELAVAKAFEPRSPAVYLTFTSAYYTWRSK